MPDIEGDKAKWITESYIPSWTEQINVKPFIAEEVPWLNAPQINQAISIET